MNLKVKKILPLIGILLVATVVVMICVFTGDVESGAMLFATIPIAGTVTTEKTHEAANDMGDDIIEKDWSKEITVIRPSELPMDTALRMIGDASTDSEEVAFGQSAMGDGSYTLNNNVSQNSAGTTISLKMTPEKFKTALVSQLAQYKDSDLGKWVQLLFVARDPSTNTVQAVVIGGAGASGDQTGANGILTTDPINFMGVAKNALDAQTEPLQHLPSLGSNYCQIHMAQVEQGMYDQMQRKTVDWGLVDYKSDALYKFRLGCELTSLIGIKSRTTDPISGKEVLTSDGLEHHVGWNMFYVPGETENNGGLGRGLFVDIGEAVMTNVNGSDERFLFATPKLISEITKIDMVQRQIDAKGTVVKYGFKVIEIETGHGIINLKEHRGLRSGGRDAEGCLVDLNRIRRRTFDKMHWREVELLKSGQSKTNAWVLEERFCCEFRVSDAHAWIYPTKTKPANAIVKV